MGVTFTPWHSCSACRRPVDLTATGRGPDACPHCGTWPLELAAHYSIETDAGEAELETRAP